MYRIGLVSLVWLLVACGDQKKPSAEKGAEATVQTGTELFSTASLPYLLSDTALLRHRDTSTLNGRSFKSFIPDSVINKIFPPGAKVIFSPIARVAASATETYFIVKASTKSKVAALLMAFEKEETYKATLPLLIPDNDPTTQQVSSIDKALSIVKAISRRNNDVVTDGKDVFIYSADAKQFILIQTDPLDDKKLDVINPIDTLRKTAKFSGDYVKSKRNIISIRDGHTPSQLLAFVHVEQGECTGELKGELLMTSQTTAIFRQGGDPCVLQFHFTSNSITLKEEEGCGNHRGLDCTFSGIFPRKKEAKPAPRKRRKNK